MVCVAIAFAIEIASINPIKLITIATVPKLINCEKSIWGIWIAGKPSGTTPITLPPYFVSNSIYHDINVVIATEINTAGSFTETFLTNIIRNIASIPISKVGLCVLSKDSDITLNTVW